MAAGQERGGPVSHVAVHPGVRAARDIPSRREFQELWFALAQRAWTSVVLVPVARDGSTATIATRLADIGRELVPHPVTAITAEALDYGAARALADLEQHVDGARDRGWEAGVSAAAPESPEGTEGHAELATRDPAGRLALRADSPGQVIVAIPPVVVEPLGLAVARGADAAVLCIDVGRARLRDARRTVELVGRDRVMGCFLVRPGPA
jgi:hypothetical protein